MCGSVKKRTDVEIPLLPNNFFNNYLSLDPGILVVLWCGIKHINLKQVKLQV